MAGGFQFHTGLNVIEGKTENCHLIILEFNEQQAKRIQVCLHVETTG